MTNAGQAASETYSRSGLLSAALDSVARLARDVPSEHPQLGGSRSYQPTAVHVGAHARLGELGAPWLEADARAGAIIAILPAADWPASDDPRAVVPPREPIEILWAVVRERAGPTLHVTCRLPTGDTLFAERFLEDARLSRKADARWFPSVVSLPRPGCWLLEVRCGEAAGAVVLSAEP